MIKEECIGKKIRARADNGCLITVVIADDKTQYKLYKNLGLDVFKENKKKSNATRKSND